MIVSLLLGSRLVMSLHRLWMEYAYDSYVFRQSAKRKSTERRKRIRKERKIKIKRRKKIKMETMRNIGTRKTEKKNTRTRRKSARKKRRIRRIVAKTRTKAAYPKSRQLLGKLRIEVEGSFSQKYTATMEVVSGMKRQVLAHFRVKMVGGLHKAACLPSRMRNQNLFRNWTGGSGMIRGVLGASCLRELLFWTIKIKRWYQELPSKTLQDCW